MIRSRLAATGLSLLVAVAVASARPTSTWNGQGSGPWDWNTASNWSPPSVPNALTNDAVFTDTSVGTVNISSNVQIGSITFNNQSSTYFLTANANQTLTVQSSITMNGTSAAQNQINLPFISTGSLLFPAGSSLTFTNNSTGSGGLFVDSNTVI